MSDKWLFNCHHAQVTCQKGNGVILSSGLVGAAQAIERWCASSASSILQSKCFLGKNYRWYHWWKLKKFPLQRFYPKYGLLLKKYIFLLQILLSAAWQCLWKLTFSKDRTFAQRRSWQLFSGENSIVGGIDIFVDPRNPSKKRKLSSFLLDWILYWIFWRGSRT